MQEQINNFISQKLSPYLCGYRKGYSTQHSLMLLTERWRQILNKKGYFGAVLMDLSKAFDCINHELLLAKLSAYGFSNSALRMMNSYLSNRKQRIRINDQFSSWSELLTGVPQGSVLGPLLFNIYINDLFWVGEYTEICNLADDNTFIASDMDLHQLMVKLEHDSALALEWFGENYMRLNSDKCHLIIGGHRYQQQFLTIGGVQVWETLEQRLLGVEINNKLDFQNHISNLCRTANQKLSALIRFSNLMDFSKRRKSLKSFIESQFCYAPLVWIFHSRTIENKINRVHERALRCVYRDDTSSFEDLLLKDGSITVHQRNIQLLAIECYKSLNNFGPSFLKDIFQSIQILTSTRGQPLPRANSKIYGHDSLDYLSAQLWAILPSELKNVDDLKKFKIEIKKWIPECPCRLCKTYIYGVGYINIRN